MADLESLGRYKLQRVLGKGAMGIVYEGLDPRLNRKVAIKTILVGQMDEATANDYSMRFAREAQAVARLNHANIVQVYDFGEEGNVAYIVMEYVRGRELKSYFDANEQFDIKDVTRLMTELLDALEFAHNAGVIHRDIKPANVMVDSDGHAKLADFGVARISDPDRQGATQIGTMVGTPAYMSPEQVQGHKIDRRTDIFSAGVILYQFLTGNKPFQGGGAWTVAKMIVQEEPPTPSSVVASISPHYDRIVSRALAKNPANRYQSAHKFAQALLRVIKGMPAEDAEENGTQSPPSGTAAWTEEAPPVPAESQSDEVELEFWHAIRDTDDPEELELYIQNFPQGLYLELARRKKAELLGKSGKGVDAEVARHLREAQARAAEEAKEKARKAAVEQAKRAAEERAREAAARAKREAEAKGLAEAREKAKREAEERQQREAAEKARREAEAGARREAEERARRDAAEKARREAEEKARREAAENARLEAEAKARREAEEKARREAAEKARLEAEAQARREAAERARLEAETKARREAQEKARREAAEKARLEAEAQARRIAEEKARREAAEKARLEAEAKARREAEEKARREAAEKARLEAQAQVRRAAEEQARREAAERARVEAEANARREAEEKVRREAQEKARLAAEARARREAEEKAHREAAEKARLEAEAKARREAEESARREAVERARLEAEAKARREAEEKVRREAAERARRMAEEQARRQAEENARQEAEASARRAAQEEAMRAAERKAIRAAEIAPLRLAREQARREAREKAQRDAEERVRIVVEGLIRRQKALAVLYKQAEGLERSGNVSEAVKLYRQACDAGDGAAAKKLGEIYAEGSGNVAPDAEEADRWFALAESLGEIVPRTGARH